MADELKRVWADLETTGLDPFKASPTGLLVWDVPLEIGLAITDKEGRIQATWDALIWEDGLSEWHQARDRAKEHPIVGPMHTENGLWAELEGTSPDAIGQRKKAVVRPSVADDFIVNWLKREGVPEGQCPLHGSSIYTDRIYLRIWFPKLHAYLHYRDVDVSTLKTECANWNPEVYQHIAEGGAYRNQQKKHRVLADIEDSINEWAFYVENFLWVS